MGARGRRFESGNPDFAADAADTPVERSETDMATLAKKDRAAQSREDWLAVVHQLIDRVAAWAKRRKWAVDYQEKQVHESRLGSYAVPVLVVRAPSGVVYVEPVARYVAKADGRIDLYSFPAMNRMMLVRAGTDWVLKTDSGVKWPEPWSEQAFTRLVELLNANE